MNFRKSVCFLICSFLFSISLHAQFLSPQELDAVNEIYGIRVETSFLETDEEKLEYIETKEKQFMEQNAENFSEQCNLILRNLFLIEKTIYMKEPNHVLTRECKNMLNEQNEINEHWIKHNKGSVDKWMYSSSGDIKCRRFEYISIPRIMREGIVSKVYFNNALEIEEKFPAGQHAIARWYYYAPHLMGGGHKKAMNCYNLAVKYSVTDAEKFYSLIYRGQIFYALKDYEKCKLDMAAAHALFPDEKYTAQINELNEKGIGFYDYYKEEED